ncbi:membrane-bound lytic murein transglycosylase MltF [Litorilituus lipolyticus]|uniref:Membrane-bound lytic murein transglycosylase F n=1 Tax=Litorilituus lipolyticus TaxID=2491017 RepID=A0A502KYJ7_9GAMM|nr:membrane-bound lytic murein transglycosylase MltF [Litorilituus lipolyticus]TPH16732.1 membrane-bound lytic murein transglycosylase MltF [Litorilituus lipolyticus]
MKKSVSYLLFGNILRFFTTFLSGNPDNNVKGKTRATALIPLLCLTLVSCKDKTESPSLSRILQRGYINVGTLFGPTNYYVKADGFAGFEYELAKKYADTLQVELRIIPSYSLDELFIKLNTGEVDLLAAGLAITDKRLKRFRFAPTYETVSQKLVFKQGKTRPRKVADLTGSLMVTSGSSYVENLDKLKLEYSELSWQETAEYDSEELLEKVLNGEIDYTIIDSNSLAVNRRYYPEISIGFSINKPEELAWMVSKNSADDILASLIEFFGKVHHDGTLLALDDKYYGHIETFDYVDTRTYIKAVEKKLPTYQPLFEKYAQDIDWRLLAAISYQESHWRPHARSHTGVRGMMMLTLATAKQMGIKSRLDAEQSIKGGAKYFKRMIDKMPDRIPAPDRIWFALASYNVGFGHLNDARIITQRQGGDPDRWVEVKKRLPLLQQKKFYKKTKYGYARGEEPVRYVENIRRYYDTLTWLDNKATELAKAELVQTEAAILADDDANVTEQTNEITNEPPELENSKQEKTAEQ